MRIKNAGRSSKPQLQARVTGVPGTLKLVAKAVRRGSAYLWQYSTDGKTWVTVGTSTEANVTVPGLTVGTVYYFRFNATFKHTTGDWSQIISFMAQ